MKTLSSENDKFATYSDIPIGTHADIVSNVNMSKVAGGLFSSEIISQKFIEMGILDIIDKFNCNINFADLGGGQGFLAYHIERVLKKLGFQLDTLLIDANIKYLEEASKEFGLKTLMCDLKSFNGKDFDLIIMRSVNHYNKISEQKLILKNAYKSLRNGGFFISQILSAETVDCPIVSQILNLHSLGRTRTDQFYITTATEFMNLATLSGFEDVRFLGNIVDYIWKPESSWDRFNEYLKEEYQKNDMFDELLKLEKRKHRFLTEANEIITKHLRTSNSSTFNNKYEIRLFFPLIRCFKKAEN